MRTQALHYYMHDGPAVFRFELTGDLDDEGARRLEQDWRTASSVPGDRQLVVDMTFVTSAGKEARTLLARWRASGVRLVANTQASRSLVQSILGTSPPEPVVRASRRAWFPIPARHCPPAGRDCFSDRLPCRDSQARNRSRLGKLFAHGDHRSREPVPPRGNFLMGG